LRGEADPSRHLVGLPQPRAPGGSCQVRADGDVVGARTAREKGCTIWKVRSCRQAVREGGGGP
jgi:hypothetical protein